MGKHDSTRLFIKNIPLGLAKSQIQQLVATKCKDLGLVHTDLKIVTREDAKGGKEKFRGIVFVGFLNADDATRFLNYYNKTYFGNCKVHIDYANLPSYKSVDSKDGNLGPKTDESRGEAAASLKDVNRVIMFNLAYNITEEQVTEFCRPYGALENVYLPLDLSSEGGIQRCNKGYCYVTFEEAADAHKFYESCNRTLLCGRVVHIQIADPKNPSKGHGNNSVSNVDGRALNGPKSSFKRKLEEKRKQEADNVDIWNLLHIDLNSAIATVASELNMHRKEILKDEDAAVNAALVETRVLNQVTEWLESQGIDVNATNVTMGRSEDILIIKNISCRVSESELLSEFLNFGTVVRFSLSPFNVLGICQYLDDNKAKAAFRALAYKNFKGTPLYLEWAPLGLVNGDKPTSAVTLETVKSKPCVDSATQHEDEDTAEAPSVTTESSGIHCSVYLKNLNFKTRNADLEPHFSKCPGYISASVVLKDKGTLATGFGFVEFDSEASARDAIRSKSGLVIDGKKIEMTISTSKRQKTASGTSKTSTTISDADVTTRLVVKNLAFQATSDEIRRLFEQYGNVTSFRLPKKLDGQHRGFAFVEYISRQESYNAYKQLHNTHLYGRKLVIEFSNNALDREQALEAKEAEV